MKRFNTNNPLIKIIQNSLLLITISLVVVLTICFGLSKLNGNASHYSQEEIEMLMAECEDNPQSVKYLVTDNCISRVYPNTTVNTFVTNFSEGEEVEVYKDELCTQRVTDGFVVSGMYAKYTVNDTVSKVYEISVLGDINEKTSKTEGGAVLLGDGVLNQIELTRGIRYCVDNENWNIDEEVEKKSADVNCNNQIDTEAVRTMVNYIVFGELNVDEIKTIDMPELEVQGRMDVNSVYKTDVVVSINETDENAFSTVYKITGDLTQDYRELVDGEEITLTQDGTYKITAYTYGQDGNKSKRGYVIITIDKNIKYTMEYYLEGTDGTYTKSDADTEIIENGALDQNVNINQKVFTDYELDVDNTNNVLSGTLTENGIVLKAYYQRKNVTYTFGASDNITGIVVANQESDLSNVTPEATKSITAKWGEKLYIDAVVDEQAGYTTTWSKWVNSIDDTDFITNKNTEIVLGKTNKSYQAKATKTINNYTITYDLAEGELPENVTNRSSYTVNTERFELTNPSRRGWIFEGWIGGVVNSEGVVDNTLPYGTTPNITSATKDVEISSGSLENRKYTAVWSEITGVPYKIEHYKETLETGVFELAETENKQGEFDENVTAVAKDYAGFTYDEGNTNEVKTGILVDNSNIVLKLYYTRNSYDLTIEKNENVATATESIQNVKYGQSVNISATMKNTAGYTFSWDGWKSSNTLKLSDIPEMEKQIIMPASDITLTATANKTPIIYTITYETNGGSLADGVSNQSTYTVESDNVTINNLVNTSKLGYEFKGWTGGVVNGEGVVDNTLPTGTTGNQETASTSVVIATGSIGNRKYIANWEEAEYNYVVKYYYEDEETYTSEPMKAKYNSTVNTFTPREMTGYKLRETPEGITISYDESLNVLNVYYIKETYTLTLQKDDNVQSVSGSGDYKYNTEVNINAVLKEEYGYDITWVKWETQTSETMADIDEQTSTITIPAGNVTLKAISNKEAINYTIGYNLNNGQLQSGNTNPESYTIETPTFTLHNPVKQGYVFAGWTGGTTDENQGTSTYISTPNETVQVESGSLGNRVYTAHWENDTETGYTVKYYKENVDGTYQLAETVDNLKGTTESEVTAPTKTYSGFELNEEMSAETKTGVVLPDGSLVLEMYYKRCFYTVTLKAGDNISKIGYTVSDASLVGTNEPVTAEGTEISANFKYGAQVSIFAQTVEQTGYTVTWNRWESSNSAIVVNQTEPNPIIGVGIGNVTLTAKATKAINKYSYKIEFYYDGTKDDSKTENKEANYGTVIANTYDKAGTGYEEDTSLAVNNPLTISEIISNNVMKIYYKHIDYTISYNYASGTLPVGYENNETYTVNTPTFTIINPIRSGYEFEGWTGSNGEIPEQTITIEQGSTGNKSYTANWIANTDTHYTVEHYKENLDGTYSKVDADTQTLTAATDSNVSAVANTYEGFTLDEDNSEAVPSGIVSANEDLVLKLFYKRNFYTLTLNAGENVASVTYSIDSTNSSVIGSGYELTSTGSSVEAKFKMGAQVGISAILNTEEDYDIVNGTWSSNNPSVNPSSLETTIIIPVSDVTLTASAIKTGKTYAYITNYYYDNVLDTENDVIERNSTYQETITNYIPRNKTGYEYKRSEGLPLVISSNKNNNVINVYYEHIDYTIEYNLDGGTLENNEEGYRTNPEVYNVKTEIFTLNNPTREGYTFLGWTGTNGETPEETVTIAQGSTGNKSYTANWRADSNIEYKVQHYIENLDSAEQPEDAPNDDNYTLFRTDGESGELTGTTDTTVTATPATISGFTYSSSKSANTISGTVASDGSLILKVYYTRNSYNLTLVPGENVVNVTNGGTVSTETIEKSYKYGQTVSINAEQQTQEGYSSTWLGWTSSNTSLLSSINVANTNVTIPAGDVTLTGNVQLTKAKFAYSAEFYYDGVKEITEIAEPVDFETQISAYPTVGKERTGYVLDHIDNLPLVVTANVTNNVIRYYYVMENYTITYELNGGELGENVTNPENYNVNTASFTLNNPTKENYSFLGWTGANGDTPEQTITIEQGSTGNRTYTANWEVDGYRVIVHHYLQGTGTGVDNPVVEVAEDEILTSVTLGADYQARNLIPTYDSNGEITNEDKDVRHYIDGREFQCVNNPANATGTFGENDIEVTFYYQYYPAVRIVSTDDGASDLVGTEYVKIADALQALAEKGLDKNSTVTKLKLIRNISNETVVMTDKNILLDLNGYTLNSKAPETIEVAGENVKQATIKLDNTKLQVVDESSSRTGKITSTYGIGVYIKTNAEFTLGVEAKPVETTPEIFGEEVGVYKDIEGDQQGIFYLFDGKVTGKKDRNSVNATVDLVPVVYTADKNPVVINGETYQCLSLAIIDNVEARIGRVTYETLESAIRAANTTVAEDGSQAEIVLVKDITKTNHIVVDNTKNIKLDLDGYTFLSTASDYAIINKGLLEIVDSSATAENKYGTGKISNSVGHTIANTYSGKTFQREYTYSDFVCPSTYGFVVDETTGSIVSNNTGIHKSTAYGYIYVDLRDKTGEYVLDVNASISSEANSDVGRGYIKTSPDISASGQEFMAISGEVTGQDSMALLQGGNEYYIHFQYVKDKNTHTGSDMFSINSIKLRSKFYGELRVSSGRIENTKSSKYGIENYGNAIIGKQNVTDIMPEFSTNGDSIHNYKDMVVENGYLNKYLENYGNVLIKNGTFGSRVELKATKDYSQVIENGTFNSYVEIYQYGQPGILTIKDGLFKSDINIGCSGGQAELYIQGGTFSNINNFRTSKMEILSGTFNGIVSTSDNAETNIIDGTFNNTLSFGSTKECTVYKATVSVTSERSAISAGNGILNLYDVTASSVRATLVNSTSIVNIYGGIYSNNNTYTIDQNNTGTINIYEGEFNNNTTSYPCIYNEKTGTITLGENDGEVSVEKPVITALSGIGIKNTAGGTFNFYDGIITASRDNTIIGDLSSIADNVDLLISYEGDFNEKEIAKLGVTNAPIAQIGEQTYLTLEDAIQNVPDNGETPTTIKLLRNLYMLNSIEIPEEKNIVLDLNANNITALTNDLVFENNGNIEIVNNNSYYNEIDLTNRVDSESGFVLDENGSLVSTNHSNNSSSNTYIVLDLTEVEQNVSVEIKASVSSESNCDFGYVRLSSGPETPVFSSTTNNIVRISGTNNAEQTFNYNVAGGKKYYLHCAYIKDGSTHRGDDIFKINSISLKSASVKLKADSTNVFINSGKMNLKNITIIHNGLGTYNNSLDVITNTGELEINGADIQENSSNMVVINNIENGKLTINSVSIKNTNSNGIGIKNSSTETVYINGGYYQGWKSIVNNNQGNIIISNGDFEGYSYSDSVCIENNDGDIDIKNATIISAQYRDGIISYKGSLYIENIETSGAGRGIANGTDSELIIDDGNINNSISNSGTLTINNGNINTSVYSTNILKIKDGTFTVRDTIIGSNNAGTIEITGGTFNGAGCIGSGSANITISNVEMTSTSSTIYTGSGNNITILSGRFISTNNSALNISSGATVTLGVKDDGIVGNTSSSNIYISGKNYGIDNSGTFNFYEGYIEGATNKAIKGSITDKESGYEPIAENIENSKQKLTLKMLPLATLGSDLSGSYTSLQDVIDASTVGENDTPDTITLTRNVIMGGTDATLNIESDKNIIIDVAGYTLTASNATLFSNLGNVTFIDSSDSKTGLITNLSGDLIECTGTGKVTFDGVKVNSTNGYVLINDTTNDVNVINSSNITGKYGIKNTSSGNVYINNSTVNCTTDSIINEGTGTVDITNGAITGTIQNTTTGNVIANSGTISKSSGQGIYNNNGSVTIKDGVTINAAQNIVNGGVDGTVEILGGSINKKIIMNKGIATISGGTINRIEVGDGAIANISAGAIPELYIAPGGTANITGGTSYNTITNEGTLEFDGGVLVQNHNTIDNKGTATFKNVDFEPKYYAVNNTGTLTLINDNITSSSTSSSYSYGIKNSGTVTVSNTTITQTAENGTGIYNTGVVNLGLENEDTSNTILVSGGAIGISQESRTAVLNYKFGTIEGAVAISGCVDTIPNNKKVEITENNGIETASLANKSDILTIDGTPYQDLQSAINNVPTNGAEPTLIKVTNDFVVTNQDTAIVEANKNIILDLDGNTIYAHGKIFENNGSLKIIDDNASKGIIKGYSDSLFSNTGTFETSVDISMEHNTCMITNDGGTVKLTSGNISVSGKNGYSNTGPLYGNVVIYTTGTGRVELTGANIEYTTNLAYYSNGNNGYHGHGIYCDTSNQEEKTEIIISGGKLKCLDTSHQYAYGIEASNANITISGGIIEANSIIDLTRGNLIITGGQLTSNRTQRSDYNYAIECSNSYLEISNNVTITSNLLRAINLAYSTMDMYSGSVSSEGDFGIEMVGSTANIWSGSVISNGSDAIYVRGSSTLTIGNSEFPVSRTEPLIQGARYGLNINSSTVDFYDGKIMGNTKAIIGSINNVPEDYSVNYYDDETVAILELLVTSSSEVEMGSTAYPTLQSAIDLAEDEEVTITLIRNIELTQPIQIANNQKITIDLNGKSIVLSSGTYVIQNLGNLKIVDSLLTGSVGSEFSKVENTTGVGIYNQGTLTLGEDDGLYHNLVPSIFGGTYGIENNGILNFFDGRIRGSTAPILQGGSSTFNYLTGYTPNISSGDQTMTLVSE